MFLDIGDEIAVTNTKGFGATYIVNDIKIVDKYGNTGGENFYKEITEAGETERITLLTAYDNFQRQDYVVFANIKT